MIQTIFLEQGKQSADTVAALFADFLHEAKTSLHLAIYDFRLGDAVARPIVEALQERAAAGVEIRLVYDAGKHQGPPEKAGADPAPPGTAEFVNRLGKSVNRKSITGGDPRQPRLMHHKYVIRDGQTPQAALWTGSTNWTEDAWTLQENNIVTIPSRGLCAFYEKDFAELWSRGDIAATGAHDTGTVIEGSATIRVDFAPGDGMAIDHEIAHQISSARRRLRLGSMLLTSGAILGALNDVIKHRNLDYAGIYDRTQMESVKDQWRGQPSEWKIAAFDNAVAGLIGKKSTPYTPEGVHDFMHNKVLVADDTVVTGSYNLSHSATENAENILIIRDPELADRYAAYLEGLANRYRGA